MTTDSIRCKVGLVIDPEKKNSARGFFSQDRSGIPCSKKLLHGIASTLDAIPSSKIILHGIVNIISRFHLAKYYYMES